MNVKIFFSFLITGIVVGVLSGGFVATKCSRAADSVSYDTVEIKTVYHVVDTVTKVKPEIHTRRIVDTISLPCVENTCSIPIEQVEYKDSLYEAWISGYMPALDSIKVFNKTTYVERKEIITKVKETSDTHGHFYGGVAVQKYDKNYVPNLTIYYNKKDFLLGVMTGVIDSKPIYGINVNFKIK